MALLDALRKLASAPSRQHLHRRALADTQAEVYRLESALGMEHSPQTLNLERLAERVEELTAKLAQNPDGSQTPAAPDQTVALPSAAPLPTLAAPELTGTARTARAFRAQGAAARLEQTAAVPPSPAASAPAPQPGSITPELTGARRTASAFRAQETVPNPTAPRPAAAGRMPTKRLAELTTYIFGVPVTYPDDPLTRQKCVNRLREVGVVVPGVEPDPHDIERTGEARTIRAMLQSKANEFLANK